MPATLFNVFISYSHASDRALATALQSWLQRYARPWYRIRSIRVFRDETDLAATPHGWKSIESALAQSDYFILMASPDAGKSPWVKREIRYWLKPDAWHLPDTARMDDPIQDPDPAQLKKFLIVLTGGEIVWREKDEAHGPGDFDWDRTTALPEMLAGVFEGEPFWVDLRESTKDPDLKQSLGRSNPAFMDAIARLSAPIRNLDINRLIGEDHRRHRQTLLTAWGAGTALTLLSIFLSAAIYLVSISNTATDKQRQFAEAGRAAAEAQTILFQQPERIDEAAGSALHSLDLFDAAAQQEIAPAWLRNTIKSFVGPGAQNPLDPTTQIQQRGWFSAPFERLKPIVEADELPLNPPERRAAVTILRNANGLLAQEVSRMAMPDAPLVQQVGFMQGDSLIFSMQFGNRIDIWRAYSGEHIRSFNMGKIGRSVNGQSNLDISQNARWIAVSAPEGRVTVYALNEGGVTGVITPELSIAPSSKVGANNREGETNQTGSVSETFQVGPAHEVSKLSAIAISHTGKYLATVSKSGAARVFELNIDSPATDGMAPKLVSAEGLTIQFQEEKHEPRIKALALNSKGNILAASSSTIEIGAGEVHVWDVPSGGRLYPPLLHDDTVNDITFSPDGTLLATAGSDGIVRIWQSNNGRRIRTIQPGGSVNSIRFEQHEDTQFIVTTGSNGLAQVWDLISGQEVVRMRKSGNVYSAAFDSTGDRLVTGSGLPGIGDPTNSIGFWNLTKAEYFIQSKIRHSSEVHAMALNATGDRLASASFYDRLSVWDVNSGTPIRHMPRRSGITKQLSFDSTGEKVVSISYANEEVAKVWDVKTGLSSPITGPGYSRTNVTGVPRYMTQAEFSDGGNKLARAIMDKEADSTFIEIWSLDGPEMIWRHPVPGSVGSLVFSGEGSRVAWSRKTAPSSVERWLQFFDLETDRLSTPLRLEDLKNRPYRSMLTMSQNGEILAAADRSDNPVYIVDASENELIQQLKSEAAITGIAVSSSGTFIAVASRDKFVRVYRIGDSVPLSELPYQGNAGDALLHFDPQDLYLYASFGSRNPMLPSIWRWLWRDEDVIQIMKARANR